MRLMLRTVVVVVEGFVSVVADGRGAMGPSVAGPRPVAERYAGDGGTVRDVVDVGRWGVVVSRAVEGRVMELGESMVAAEVEGGFVGLGCVVEDGTSSDDDDGGTAIVDAVAVVVAVAVASSCARSSDEAEADSPPGTMIGANSSFTAAVTAAGVLFLARSSAAIDGILVATT
jgi:hypothetical protein